MGISVYSLHRNPAIFAEPTRFDPDRFTPERERQLPRHSYMPFSDGPRQCIGNHFALMEGQIVLATLAQAVQFELLTTAPVRPLPLITLRPAGPVAVQVRRVGS
jgi:cytochrome P450